MDSNDLRDSLFNTINLLNDLEAGVSTPPRDKNKDIELSSTFVKGIKDKLINTDKPVRSDNGSGVHEEHVLQLKDVFERQLIEVHKALQSQGQIILALKNEIKLLKEEQKNNERSDIEKVEPFQQQSSFQQQSEFQPSSESQSSFEKSKQPSFGEEQQMLHQQNEPVQMSFNDEPESGFIGQSVSQQTQQPIQQQISQPTPQPAVAQPQVQPPQQPQPPKETNPRVGNYNSNDVAIEKFFYFGDK